MSISFSNIIFSVFFFIAGAFSSAFSSFVRYDKKVTKENIGEVIDDVRTTCSSESQEILAKFGVIRDCFNNFNRSDVWNHRKEAAKFAYDLLFEIHEYWFHFVLLRMLTFIDYQPRFINLLYTPLPWILLFLSNPFSAFFWLSGRIYVSLLSPKPNDIQVVSGSKELKNE
jgi:hypothetical protein